MQEGDSHVGELALGVRESCYMYAVASETDNDGGSDLDHIVGRGGVCRWKKLKKRSSITSDALPD